MAVRMGEVGGSGCAGAVGGERAAAPHPVKVVAKSCVASRTCSEFGVRMGRGLGRGREGKAEARGERPARLADAEIAQLDGFVLAQE